MTDKFFAEPDNRELRQIIGAQSYQFDDELRAKGADPEKLRSRFNEMVQRSGYCPTLDNHSFNHGDSDACAHDFVVRLALEKISDRLGRHLNREEIFIAVYDEKTDNVPPSHYADEGSRDYETLYIVVYKNDQNPHKPLLECFLILQHVCIDYNSVYYDDDDDGVDVVFTRFNDERPNLGSLLLDYPLYIPQLFDKFGDVSLIINLLQRYS